MSLVSYLMASVYDLAIGRMERTCLGSWRAELLTQARGHVLEIGSGTGANLPHYPESINSLTLSEPDPHMRRKLRQKLGKRPFPVSCVETPAERLDFPDATFDSVVSTLVLCSVANQARVLTEIRRVLKSDGRLLFIEHVRAATPQLLKWQQRLQPLWVPLCGNCHLTRDTEQAIRAAGFEISGIRHLRSRGAPAVVSPTIVGAASPKKSDKPGRPANHLFSG